MSTKTKNVPSLDEILATYPDNEAAAEALLKAYKAPHQNNLVCHQTLGLRGDEGYALAFGGGNIRHAQMIVEARREGRVMFFES